MKVLSFLTMLVIWLVATALLMVSFFPLMAWFVVAALYAIIPRSGGAK